MYELLKNTLNFNNFKNIKIDLISKIDDTHDTIYSHEESDLLHFLKYKELTSQGLNFNELGSKNSENAFSVRQKVKDINILKRYLNGIVNLQQDETLDLDKNISVNNSNNNDKPCKYNMDSRLVLSNVNVCDSSNKQVLYLQNDTTQEVGKKNGLLNKRFTEILYKKIKKDKHLKNTFFKNLLSQYAREIHNNDDKYIQIKNLKIMNDRLNTHLKLCKNAIFQKYHSVKNIKTDLKKNAFNKCILKPQLNSIKSNTKFQRSRKIYFFKINDSNNNKGQNIRKVMIDAKKNNLHVNGKNCVAKENYNIIDTGTNNFEQFFSINNAFDMKPYFDKKDNSVDFNEDKQTRSNNFMNKRDETYVDKNCMDEKDSKICKEENINNVKSHICGATKYKNVFNKLERRKNNKVNELNGYTNFYENKDAIIVYKNMSNLKNINLSILRRMSTSYKYNTKKYLNKNKDPRLKFLSNNINFYKTDINKKMYKEEVSQKTNCFSDNIIIQNGEINEIKEKIKMALMNLNNIKKNNYKLKFSLEKEILDNAIHHNELKKYICSPFDDKASQKSSVDVNKGYEIVKSDQHESINQVNNNSNDVKLYKGENTERDTQRMYNNNNNDNNNNNNIIIDNTFLKTTTLHKTDIDPCKNIINVYNSNNEKNEKINANPIEGNVKLMCNATTYHLNKNKLENETKENNVLTRSNNCCKDALLTYTKLEKKTDTKDKKTYLNNRVGKLNRKEINEHNGNFKCLKNDEKNDTINSLEKIHNCNWGYEETANKLKNCENKKSRASEELLSVSCSNKLKKSIKKDNVDNANCRNIIKLRADCKKRECIVYENCNNIISEKSELVEHFQENNSNKKNVKKKRFNLENKKIKLLNKNDSYINNTHIVSTFKSIFNNDDKKINIQNNFNNYKVLKKSFGLEQIILNNTKKKKEYFDFKNVKNIKKIIISEIYVNKELEKINKRNQMVINIIERYIKDKNKTCYIFPKEEKKMNMHFQTNCALENQNKVKQTNFLPGLYDHYASLLLNYKNN
ncbi:conserved protein, unknown function [Hepatocystis sp. ex Piliocolobus tephrosceles]|nr:conserved protein, unknown function [Hepatocystis sp. ex Piliocolobus tephrosceles]